MLPKSHDLKSLADRVRSGDEAALSAFREELDFTLPLLIRRSLCARRLTPALERIRKAVVSFARQMPDVERDRPDRLVPAAVAWIRDEVSERVRLQHCTLEQALETVCQA